MASIYKEKSLIEEFDDEGYSSAICSTTSDQDYINKVKIGLKTKKLFIKITYTKQSVKFVDFLRPIHYPYLSIYLWTLLHLNSKAKQQNGLKKLRKGKVNTD